MNSRTVPAVTCIVVILLLLIFGGFAIYKRNHAPINGIVPVDGMLVISSIKIADTDSEIHWRWTITGDRAWSTFGSQSGPSGDLLTFQRTSIGSGLLVGEQGSSAITYEIDVVKSPGFAPNQLSYDSKIEMKGNNGTPASSQSSSFSSAQKRIRDVAAVLQVKDETIPMFQDVKLAKLNGRTITLRFSR
jgi:hypothetical protein